MTPAAASAVQVVSRTPAGAPGNGGSLFPLMSGDGRFVAYSSTASNLVAGDRNGDSDVFLRNLASRRTVRVSAAPGGGQANGDSYPLIHLNVEITSGPDLLRPRYEFLEKGMPPLHF